MNPAEVDQREVFTVSPDVLQKQGSRWRWRRTGRVARLKLIPAAVTPPSSVNMIFSSRALMARASQCPSSLALICVFLSLPASSITP